MASTHQASKPNGRASPRHIGVYVCHCGTNIAGMVDVAAVAKHASQLDEVAIARHYAYMCSDPGQALIKEDIRDYAAGAAGAGRK